MRYIFCLLCGICVLASASFVGASSESAFRHLDVVIAPLPHATTAGYPFELGEHFYFTKTTSRIFFQENPVTARVIHADIGKEKAEFTFKNDKFGQGIITIVSDRDLRSISDADLKNVLMKAVSDKGLSSVYIDKNSGLFHLATCNHLPSNGNRIESDRPEAVAKGYRPCGVCFFKQLLLPEIEVERTLEKKGAAELRHYNERIIDSAVQERVDRVGGKVVKEWPYPLIGYDYRFKVVESTDINAYALAAGSIFVTTGLLGAVENDDELEAVLAHEIGHVERRHSLQSYKTMLANQQAQATLQMLGAVAVGVAAGTNNNAAAGAIGAVTLASMVAVNLQQIGYPKEQEAEADELAIAYFRKNGKNLQPLKSVFHKLMYHNLTSIHDPDPASLSHPALGSRLNGVDSSSIYFPADALYHWVNGEGGTEFKIHSITRIGSESRLIIGVSDFRSLKNFPAETSSLVLSDSHNSVEFYSLRLLPTDPWGGLVIAQGTVREINVDDLKSVGFSTEPQKAVFGTGPKAPSFDLMKGAFY